MILFHLVVKRRNRKRNLRKKSIKKNRTFNWKKKTKKNRGERRNMTPPQLNLKQRRKQLQKQKKGKPQKRKRRGQELKRRSPRQLKKRLP